MNYKRLKIWFIITFTLGVITVIIRAIWQIVVIPTPGTLLISLPIIAALLGMNALFAYLIVKPVRMRSLPFSIGFSVVITAGLLAGVIHYVRFITSPDVEAFLSKVISTLILISSFNVYLIVLSIIWSLRKSRGNGQRKI